MLVGLPVGLRIAADASRGVGAAALPPRAPLLLQRARSGRAVSALWRGRFYAGALPYPLPPHPPPA